MTCAEAAAGVTDYLDSALGATDRARFERHLDHCEDCRVYVAEFAQTLNALGALRRDDLNPDPDGMAALLAAFREHAG